MSLFTDPALESLIPHAGTTDASTTDPMSIWEEVEKPQPKRPENSGSKQPPTTPPKPDKKG